MKEAREGNRPQRRVYRMTDEGEAVFQRLLRENLADFTAAKTSSDIGLAFVDALPKPESLRLLEQRRDTLARQLAETKEAPLHAGGPQLLIEHQLSYLRNELAWLTTAIERVRAG